MNRNSHAICRIVSLSTRSALGRAHLPPTTVFRRLKTTNTWDFPDVIKFRVAVHTLWEKARAQKLISSSMSRHSTRNISSKFMHAFLSNLAHRQTDRQTNAGARAKTSTSSVVGGKWPWVTPDVYVKVTIFWITRKRYTSYNGRLIATSRPIVIWMAIILLFVLLLKTKGQGRWRGVTFGCLTLI